MRLGLSTPDFINEQLFCDMKDAGITDMEISVSKELSEKLDYGKIKEWSEKYEINLWSFHLPFWPFSEIDISKPELAEYSVEYLKGYIDKATEIGIDKFVIHASGEPIDVSERAVRMQTAKESLCDLANYAEKRGAYVLVENLPRTCLGRNSSEILELLSAHKALKACFDTNHLLGEDYIKFIHVLGKNIASTHISDYDFKDERHWLPGEGQIDWQALLLALKEVGYDKMWLYEIGLNAPWTIKRERDLLISDFSENARAIFNGNAPKPLGTPTL